MHDTLSPSPTTVRDAVHLLAAKPLRVDGIAMTITGRPLGEAPTVLLIHGLGATRACWAPILPELADRYHVIATDNPGHGVSLPLEKGERADAAYLADRVLSAVERTGVQRPHVVGSSLGGWMGLELAADNRIASLSALSPGGLWLEPHDPSIWLSLNRKMAQLAGGLSMPLMGLGLTKWISLHTICAHPTTLDTELSREAVRGIAKSTSYETIKKTLVRNRFDRGAAVPTSIPVATVFGDHDQILPAPRSQEKSLLPAHSSWEIVDSCGHLPMWDHPDHMLSVINSTIAAA